MLAATRPKKAWLATSSSAEIPQLGPAPPPRGRTPGTSPSSLDYLAKQYEGMFGPAPAVSPAKNRFSAWFPYVLVLPLDAVPPSPPPATCVQDM